jgi:hypothetical protein
MKKILVVEELWAVEGIKPYRSAIVERLKHEFPLVSVYLKAPLCDVSGFSCVVLPWSYNGPNMAEVCKKKEYPSLFSQTTLRSCLRST